MRTPTELRLAVKRGAEFLDKQKPTWVDTISFDDLDISCPKGCVFGQVFDDEAEGAGGQTGFDYGVEVLLGGDCGAAEDLGFDALSPVDYRDYDLDDVKAEYVALQELWKAEVEARRGRPDS